MAKVIVDFGAAGIVIGGLTWAACQRQRDQVAVSTAGSTLTAFDAVSKYWLENPNVTEDTLFDIYVTATPTTRVLDKFLSPTSLEICNNAILGLGGNTITSFDDTTRAEAVLCESFWPQALNATLRLHPWNCAIKRAVLTPDVTPPTYEWTYAFSLPSDLLRLLELDGVTEYKIEGRKILCDESALSIRYVFRNENTAEWDTLLIAALTAYMAFQLSYPLTKSNTTRGEQWKLFTELLRTAKSIDAQEEPGDTMGDFPFINVRR